MRWLWAVLLAGCAKDPTQLIVRVDSDFAVPGEMNAVHAIVRDDAGEISSEHTFQLPGEVQIPFSFGVSYRDGSPNQNVRIELEALGSSGTLTKRTAATSFIEGKTLLLPLFLAKSCEGVSCGSGMTCTEHGCDSEQIPSSTLVEIEPGDETRFDGGVITNPDAGVEPSNILVEPTSGLFTSEGGASVSFTVRLASEPTSYVGVTLASSDPMEGTIDTDLLTFTPLDWETPKTVVVTGVDDGLDDGDRTFAIVTSPAVSGDPMFDGVDPPDVSIINSDDDQAEIVLLGSEGLSTTERGGTATFSIVLGSRPAGDVVLRFSSSDPTEGLVTTASASFTAADWDVPRHVTAVGMDDEEMDGPVVYQVTIDPMASPDPVYAELGATSVSITNSDDEAPGVTVSPTAGLITSEAGDGDTFTVVLNTQPTADVVISLASDSQAEGVASPGQLTFTAQNWGVPQEVTVTGADDLIDDGDQAYTIVLNPPATTDLDYGGIDPADVGVTNTDDDTAGFEIVPLNGLVTSESGDPATFTVRLLSEPTGMVSLGVASSNPSEGTVAPSDLGFDPTNWSVPQTVTITGVDDMIADGPAAYSILTGPATGDATYAAIDPPDVAVVNADDDSPGIIVSPTSVMTTEAGGMATFTLRLTTQPTADVTVALSSNDTGEATVSPASIVLTAANWDTPRTVTVTGVDDPIDDGDATVSIVTAPSTSSDPTYANIDPADVTVTNRDDDTAQIIVAPQAGLMTTEAGGTATFTVRLGTEPTANVVVGLSSNDPGEGSVTPTSLTFTSANWSTPRTVTVMGVQDNIDDGNISYTIVTSAAVSSDPAYNNLNPPNVSVINVDDDVAGIVVSAANITTRESGPPATFTIVLRTQPSSDVTIGLMLISGGGSSNNEVSVAPGSVTFTPASWGAPQTVTVTPSDDGVLDGDRTYTVATQPATSVDPQYFALDAADVPGTNLDDGLLPATSISTPMVAIPQGNSEHPEISADGRLVAFASSRVDLVPNDTNNTQDVFVYFRGTMAWERVSVSSGGVQGNGPSVFPAISHDGRWVAFQSSATNLVPNDTNNASDIFLRDRMMGTTTRVSVTTGGGEASMPSTSPSISGDGRYVIFASNYSFDGGNGHRLWRHDRIANTTVGAGMAFQGGDSQISQDGQYSIFESTGIDPSTVAVYEQSSGTQYLVGSPSAAVSNPAITPDGSLLLYASGDFGNGMGDTNGFVDAFLQMRVGGAPELLSIGLGAVPANGDSTHPYASDNGDFVVFISTATNLTNGTGVPGRSVFLRDRRFNATTMIAGNVDDRARISGDGRFIVYVAPPGPNAGIFMVSR